MNALAVPDNLTPVTYEQYNSARREKSPTDVSWPPMLPIELALKEASPQEIRHSYGYSTEEWDALPQNPVFMRDLADALELVKQEGMSFKLKAKLIAEENLKTVWQMVHASGDDVPPSVKADLIKSVARWAGFEPKSSDNAQGAVAANTLNIQINLGGDE